eukprot:gb/GECG01002858.1/.p1 GENE.gb/GECG01002858.1/~~gb/GECG01002858.1/.p1  ORF type:complete len:255 (+),score=23.75 gb/GECG01002858.1/:1-765(+)
MKHFSQTIFCGAVLAASMAVETRARQLLRSPRSSSLVSNTVDLWPNQNVSTSTFNSMHDGGVNQVVIPCLLPDNTQDPSCVPNIKNSMASKLSKISDILLVPNARYGHAKEQVDNGLANVPWESVGWIWIDVSYAAYWPGPASSSQAFLGDIIQEVQKVTGNGGSYLGIRTFYNSWIDLMGDWTSPSNQGMRLWHVLLDGDAETTAVNFGGWNTVTYKQFLLAKTFESTQVNFDVWPALESEWNISKDSKDKTA